MTHNRRFLKQAAFAASLALCAPLMALAQPGPGGQMGQGGPGMQGMQGMHRGSGMHEGHGMSHGMGQGRGGHGHGMHEGKGGMGGMDGGMRMLRGLNLTEAQRDQVFNLMHKQAPAARERAKAIQKSRLELRNLSMSAQYDDARAKTLADSIAAATAEMALTRARTGQEIYKLLTPEQRKQADDMRARFEQRRGMGGMGGHGAGPR